MPYFPWNQTLEKNGNTINEFDLVSTVCKQLQPQVQYRSQLYEVQQSRSVQVISIFGSKIHQMNQ